MDVSKYKSVSEWRDDLIAQVWRINATAGCALSETIKVLGLSFQEAFNYLVRNKILVFVGQASFTKLNFQTLLKEAATVKKSLSCRLAIRRRSGMPGISLLKVANKKFHP